MKKIIKYILITIIVLIGTGSLINNSFASNQSDSCYDSYRKDSNGNYKTRDSSFFWDVYNNCSDIRQHDYYTFPNGDKVETWSIWDKTASEIISSNFTSFKDWANSEKEEYEKDYPGRIGNEVKFSDNFDDVGAFVGCYNSFYVKLTNVGDPCSGKYDTKDPIVYARDTKEPNIHPTGKWQKENIEIQLFVSDDNFSTGIEYSQYIWDEPTKCKSNGSHFDNGDKITLSEEGVHTLYLCAGDNGNILGGKTCSETHSGNWEGVFKLDKDKPPITTPGTIIFDKNNIKAQNYHYNLIIDNSKENDGKASPIKTVKVQIENEENKNNFITKNLSNPSVLGNNYKFSFTWPMKYINAKGGDTISNGARKYTIKVLEVCDEAGNCSTDTINKEHNVYAAEISKTKSIIYSNELTSGKIADGSDSKLEIKLKDEFGNSIVPVNLNTGNTINSDVDLTINYNNKLRKNQYSNVLENSAVYYKNTQTKVNGNNIQFKNKSNGDYSFDFNVYAPTINGNTFSIYPIETSYLGKTKIFDGTIKFSFKPLYDSEISDDSDQKNGLIEGIYQEGKIKLKLNGDESNVYKKSKKIRLDKTGSAKDKFSFANKENEKIIYTPDSNNFYDFKTRFIANPGIYIDEIKNVGVLPIVEYNTSKGTIKYKSNEFGIGNQNNSGLKVKGNTNISEDKIEEITQNQNSENIHNLSGNINKASLKKDIRQKAYSTIKNISSNENGKTFGDIIYYDLTNSSNKVKEINTSALNTNKTIIVKGGNLYITGSSTTGNNFPGVIVLKDDNGNGGNLYIDPKISRLDGVFYVDKSIMSYNDLFGEISPNNGGTYSVLKNQLFINGSVFSENTIGGSRKNPPVCPFYTKDNCDLDSAQKYDLNYLRRGVENKSDSSLENYPVIIKYNPKLQLNPPALFSN